mmetsp:Transcript_101740/g.294421  ORF Transcript_101740/g.294421 Transcript_101740/m.294421 type:complete len:516 (+) Transcript_101740:135-1682(+)
MAAPGGLAFSVPGVCPEPDVDPVKPFDQEAAAELEKKIDGSGEQPARPEKPKVRMSMASAYDAAYIMTEDELRQFWRNSVWTSVSYGFSTAAYVVIAFAMPYSLNYILNGSPEIVSSESAGLLSVSLSINMACAIVLQEAWGRCGSWFGRKWVMVAIALLVSLSGVACLLGHMLRLSGLWILSSALVGASSAMYASSSTYCADMSTAENFGKTTGTLTAMGSIGACVGFVIPVVFASALHIALWIALAFALVALLLFAFVVPDVSPPLEKRSKLSKGDICQALLMCSVFKSFFAQTRYTQMLLGTMFLSGAAFGCMRVWIVSWGMLYYGISVQMTGTVLLLFFAGGAVAIMLGTRFLPAQLGCSMLMWMEAMASLTCTVGPAAFPVLCISLVLDLGATISGSFLTSMYFGQVSSKRRGELTALHSLAEKLGTLLGVTVITPVIVDWITAYMMTGQGTWLTPPMIQLVFDGASVILYYSARLFLRHQDKFGVFVLRTDSEKRKEMGSQDDEDPTSD